MSGVCWLVLQNWSEATLTVVFTRLCLGARHFAAVGFTAASLQQTMQKRRMHFWWSVLAFWRDEQFGPVHVSCFPVLVGASISSRQTNPVQDRPSSWVLPGHWKNINAHVRSQKSNLQDLLVHASSIFWCMITFRDPGLRQKLNFTGWANIFRQVGVHGRQLEASIVISFVICGWSCGWTLTVQIVKVAEAFFQKLINDLDNWTKCNYSHPLMAMPVHANMLTIVSIINGLHILCCNNKSLQAIGVILNDLSDACRKLA